MKPIYEIIKSPLLTEKGTALQDEHNIYCFEVGMTANKVEIKAAIEELFDVEVASVRTLIVRGKAKRFGRQVGRRSNWKKAYVKVKGDKALDLMHLA